jgi:hypothetical protein
MVSFKHRPIYLSREPLVPTEMNTSWTPQPNALSSRTNNLFVYFRFSSHVPSAVPDARTWSTPFMARVNISEVNVTKHKILTVTRKQPPYSRAGRKEMKTRKRGRAGPPTNSIKLIVIIILPLLHGGQHGNWCFNNTDNHSTWLTTRISLSSHACACTIRSCMSDIQTTNTPMPQGRKPRAHISSMFWHTTQRVPRIHAISSEMHTDIPVWK